MVDVGGDVDGMEDVVMDLVNLLKHECLTQEGLPVRHHSQSSQLQEGDLHVWITALDPGNVGRGEGASFLARDVLGCGSPSPGDGCSLRISEGEAFGSVDDVHHALDVTVVEVGLSSKGGHNVVGVVSSDKGQMAVCQGHGVTEVVVDGTIEGSIRLEGGRGGINDNGGGHALVEDSSMKSGHSDDRTLSFDAPVGGGGRYAPFAAFREIFVSFTILFGAGEGFWCFD